MNNVFRKCLKKEFGKTDYGRYVSMCRNELKGVDLVEEIKVKDKAVYKDMAEKIRKMQPDEIDRKKEKLADTLVEAFRIARYFGVVFIFYVVASLVLIALNLRPEVTNISLVLMGICFLYKTYEFVCNKFCFVDAYLIMVYKSVLEQASN